MSVFVLEKRDVNQPCFIKSRINKRRNWKNKKLKKVYILKYI